MPGDHRDLYRYVVAENRDEYIALMRLFTTALYAEMSAGEAAAALEAAGVVLSADEVAARCDQLEAWGNLVRSVRDARVATVAEYLKSRSRYQVSKLGGRVHREVEDVMAAADGAREVARELLRDIAERLARIAAQLAAGDPDAEALAADVTTVFSNHQLFFDSVRDFYAYLQQVLARYDLAGSEYVAFKDLLLQYIDVINADVNRYAPAVWVSLQAVDARRADLLAVLEQRPGLALPDAPAVERSPGRTGADWDGLVAWYDPSTGHGGPDRLQTAARLALGQLLANAKRIIAASGAGVSRRSDLLRLAVWFHQSDIDTAHRLFNAAFGAYPARHLLLGPDEPDPRAGPATSWWDDAAVEVPVSLRERGDRAARGRTSRVPDHSAARSQTQARARREEQALQAAAAELIAAGDLHGARVSVAARNLLLDRVADLFAAHQAPAAGPVSVADASAGLVLTAEPSAAGTVLDCPDGRLQVEGLALRVRAERGSVPGAAVGL